MRVNLEATVGSDLLKCARGVSIDFRQMEINAGSPIAFELIGL